MTPLLEQRGDPVSEVLERREIANRIDDEIAIERHVLVDHDIPETWQSSQMLHELGGEFVVGG